MVRLFLSPLRDKKQSWTPRLGRIKKRERPIHVICHRRQASKIFLQLGCHFRFDESNGPSRVVCFKANIKPWLASLQHELTASVMPFERPHHLPRPDMNRKSTTDHQTGQRCRWKMGKWRQLHHIDRLIRQENIRTRDLEDGPVWMSPFLWRNKLDHLRQRLRPNCRKVASCAREIGLVCLLIQFNSELNVDWTIHLK